MLSAKRCSGKAELPHRVDGPAVGLANGLHPAAPRKPEQDGAGVGMVFWMIPWFQSAAPGRPEPHEEDEAEEEE